MNTIQCDNIWHSNLRSVALNIQQVYIQQSCSGHLYHTESRTPCICCQVRWESVLAGHDSEPDNYIHLLRWFQANMLGMSPDSLPISLWSLLVLDCNMLIINYLKINYRWFIILHFLYYYRFFFYILLYYSAKINILFYCIFIYRSSIN